MELVQLLELLPPPSTILLKTPLLQQQLLQLPLLQQLCNEIDVDDSCCCCGCCSGVVVGTGLVLLLLRLLLFSNNSGVELLFISSFHRRRHKHTQQQFYFSFKFFFFKPFEKIHTKQLTILTTILIFLWLIVIQKQLTNKIFKTFIIEFELNILYSRRRVQCGCSFVVE